MQYHQALTIGILLVAAGRGERAGASSEGPKQYRRIGGEAVLAHTLRRFLAWPHSGPIVVVIHPDDEALFAAATAGLAPADRVATCAGGATRQQSVLAGLRRFAAMATGDGDLPGHVMIHDAVRPFIDSETLDRVRHALASGERCVLPVIPVSDTLKRADTEGMVGATVSRSGLYAAQTPQSFAFGVILAAHEKAEAEGRLDFTDDAAIAEWSGLPVKLVDGSPDNIKLTVKRDIDMADLRMRAAAVPDIRTGNGYDVHQLEPGDGVTLCGLLIPHNQRLKGHSDADVALHALTDALLATCGAGDIGDHFPPSDPQWRGAASRIFLEHAARIVRAHGGTILNADVTLIAEAPRIGPHRQTMRENLAAFLDIAPERCSVKATTNEQIGFIGRREGIAAIATATVYYESRRDD